MAGLLNIGISGLNASQAGLLTTGHNITNAGTVGYNRQTVQTTTNEPQFSGVGFFGQGTRISAVTRSYSQFLENQVLNAENRRSELSTYNAQISQINNLLADSSAGLSPALEGFFSGVQEVAANPSNLAARQAMISNAQSLVSRFQSMDSRLSEIRQGVEDELAGSIEQVNSLATAIGDINQKIVIAQSVGTNVPANDLLDQRNKMIADLNQIVKVNAVAQNDGAMNVFIASGQTLVMGPNVMRLGTQPSQNDPTKLAVTLIGPSGSASELPESLLTGGTMGALLGFRRESLDPAQNRLGLMALGIAEAFNAQHREGQDLEGMLGLDFFKSPAVAMRPDGAANVTVDPQALGNLTGSDYQLINEDGTNFSLVRLTDNVRVINSAPLPASVDGLQISAGSLGVGETALIQPTRFAARDIGVAITDPRKLAAGNPVSSSASLANGGSGRIEGIEIGSTAGMVTAPSLTPNFAQISLSYSAGTNSFTVPAGFTLSSGTPPVADSSFNPATDSVGKRFILTSPAGFEFSFTAAGTPANGDAFTFSATDKGVADNRNATLLGALQTTKILFASGTGEPTATLQTAYSQIVTSIGNKTREVQVGERAQDALVQQATEARDALSGVNLDEEAANLVRFQQSYQAAGRVISIAQTLFDEVLSLAR